MVINIDLAFAIFSWEEFCQDTSLEKAGWYINSSEQHKLSFPSTSIDFNQETCLKSSGLLALEISSSQFRETELSTRSKRLATW